MIADQEDLSPPEQSPEESDQSLEKIIRTSMQVQQYVEAEIARQGVYLDEQQLAIFRERSKKNLEKLLGVLATIIPDRFKPKLWDVLSNSHEWQLAYINSLNPERFSDELQEISAMYLYQIGDLIQKSAEQSDHNLPSIHQTLARVLVILEKMTDQSKITKVVQDSFYALDETKQPEDSSINQLNNRVLSILVDKRFDVLNIDQQKNIISRMVGERGIDASDLVGKLPVSSQVEILKDLAEAYGVDKVKRSEIVIKFVSALDIHQRTEILRMILNHIGRSSLGLQDSLEMFHVSQRYLDLALPQDRAQIIDAFLGSRSSRSFSTSNGELQLRQICAFTDDQAEREMIFWRVVERWVQYPSIKEFNIEDMVLRLEPRQAAGRIIDSWHEEGTVGNHAFAVYGEKVIRQKMADGELEIYALVSMADHYGVDLALFQVNFEREIQRIFGSGEFTPELHALAHRFHEVNLKTEWQPFDLDIQASLEYGETTWRAEQSLVDLLQNHLDAQSYILMLKIAQAVFGTDENNGGKNRFDLDDLNKLWNFRQRWPFSTDAPYAFQAIPFQFRDKPEELAAMLTQVEVPGIPRVEVLIIDEQNEEKWLTLEELQSENLNSEIVGVRFEDNGLGYDKNLNAMFAPTKQGLPFFRGRFGQGAKMSMIALLREGCHVEISSSAINEDTGEISKWTGQPSLSEGTVHFVGQEQRSFSTGAEEATGTITVIRFNQANSGLKKTFQAMLDNRQDNEGLGRYVLDYHSLKDTFLAGSLETNSMVSVSTELQGRIYVQGLEVPARGSETFAFCYNFASGDVLTGRDRTFLENDKVEKEVVNIWKKVTDETAVTALYQILLPLPETKLSVLGMGAFESNKLSRELCWGLSQEVLEAHGQVIRKLLHINTEGQKVVLVQRDDFKKNPDAKEKMIAAGYNIFVETSMFSDVPRLLENALGKDQVLGFHTVWREIANIRDNEVFEPTENLRQQSAQLLLDAQQAVSQLLFDLHEESLISIMETQQFDFIFRYLPGERNIDFIRPLVRQEKQEDGQWTKVGYHFTFYPQMLNEDGKVPEVLTPEQAAHVQYTLEWELLTILYLHKVNHEGNWFQQYRFGQDLANLILEVNSHQAPEAIEQAQKLESDYQIPVIDANSALPTMENDRRIIALIELVINLENEDITYEEVKAILPSIEETIERSADLTEWLWKRISRRKISGKRFTDDNEIWELVSAGGIDKRPLLELRIVPHREIGKIGSRSASLVGEGTAAVLTLPFDFSQSEVAVIRVGNQEYPISRYKKRTAEINAHFGFSTTNGPDDFFATKNYLEESYFENRVYVENGMICFPIGSSVDQIVDERARYFLDQLDVSIYVPGITELEEDMQGQPYIETSASTEYGEGKVWDDPIRIFGDILQNHLDAGSTTIRFHLAGETESVDQNQLLQEQYRDAQIIGVIFEDNGNGFTTHGLRRWGDSAKRLGGKKGRFGEGLKMLAVSCARNGLELNCSSRQWKAHVNAKDLELLSHGHQRTVKQVGFDMTWFEESRGGSATELRIPQGGSSSPRANEIWNQWLAVLDPRRETDESGYRGLARYVREIRESSGNEIKIGRVTILPGEPGKIFERGLVVPDAAKRLGTNFMFGIDIDANIIATQERNVVDKDKLFGYLERAYANAPYSLCHLIMTEIHRRATFKGAADAFEQGNLAEGLSMMTEGKQDKLSFEEFRLISKVEDIEPLRLAYYEVFGDRATLSSASAAESELENGGTYDTRTGKNVPFTEEQRAMLEGIIRFEKTNFPEDHLIVLDKQFRFVRDRLNNQVHSTRTIFESFMSEAIEINPDRMEQLQATIQATAAQMVTTFEAMRNTLAGNMILNKLMSDPTRTEVKFDKIGSLEQNDLDYALSYLQLVSMRLMPLRIKVVNGILGAEAFVHGPAHITYSETLLKNPEKLVATIQHELLHLAFRTADYNPTFLGLLLLVNQEFAWRHAKVN